MNDEVKIVTIIGTFMFEGRLYFVTDRGYVYCVGFDYEDNPSISQVDRVG